MSTAFEAAIEPMEEPMLLKPKSGYNELIHNEYSPLQVGTMRSSG